MKKSAVVIAGTAILVGGGALAATANSEPETLHACVQKRDGGMRLADNCRPSEYAVSWNVQGPAGPTGSPGPTGPPGPAELNVTLRERTVTFTVQPMSSGQGPAGASAGCAAGETVLSGGPTTVGADLLPLRLFNSGPVFDGTSSGWRVDWVNPTDSPVTATVTMAALCTPGTMAGAG